jgi:hypothetical protein
VTKPPPQSPSSAAAGIRLDHIQNFLEKTHGQLTIGEIPPIRRAALAAVGKKVRVALVCGEKETALQLLQRLDAALATSMAKNTVIDEVLPEIQRRRGST